MEQRHQSEPISCLILKAWLHSSGCAIAIRSLGLFLSLEKSWRSVDTAVLYLGPQVMLPSLQLWSWDGVKEGRPYLESAMRGME